MRRLLFVDASINLVLGLLLLFFPGPLVDALGMPKSDQAFYPSILGAVLFGIAIALLIQVRNAGGLGLAYWLSYGSLILPPRGLIGLWFLVPLLVVLSGVELTRHRRQRKAGQD